MLDASGLPQRPWLWSYCSAVALAHAASAQAPPDRAAVLERFRTAVVRVEVEGRAADGKVARPRLGTGVIVGANGLIVTAGHVVGRDEEWAETAPDSGLRERRVRVTGLDGNGVERPLGNASVELVPGQDLALLHVRARNLPEAPLAERVPPDNASVVALLWEPGGVPEPVTADLVPTDQARFGGLLTARVGVEEGNSGSGLFDAQLRLAGIIVNRIDARRALAVPAAWIKPAVDLRRRPRQPPRRRSRLPLLRRRRTPASGRRAAALRRGGGTGLTVPLDRDTTVAAFQAQAGRDQTGREAILKYFSDLPSNIEVQLGQVSLTEFAPDPSFVALKAPSDPARAPRIRGAWPRVVPRCWHAGHGDAAGRAAHGARVVRLAGPERARRSSASAGAEPKLQA